MNMDKASGALWGLALGDAAGVPFELMTSHQVLVSSAEEINLQVFGEREGELERDPPVCPWPRGSWSDDTAMSLAVIGAYRLCHGRGGGIPTSFELIRSCAFEFVNWLEHDGRGAGRHTRTVLTEVDFTQSPLAASRRVWLRHDRKCGNGAVMRAPAVGLLQTRPAQQLEIYESLAKITHFDPIAVLCSVFLSRLTRLLVDGMNSSAALRVALFDLRSRYEYDGNDSAHSERHHVRLEHLEWLESEVRFVSMDITVSSHLGLDSKPWCTSKKTLRAGLWALCNLERLGWRRVVSMVTQCGGDTDTNAAVAGALCGAAIGLQQMREDVHVNKLLGEIHHPEPIQDALVFLHAMNEAHP